uniref:FP protein C-terminal domain-containing protein n=1 Tax=Heliothis virescens TaxID=7102 RepID=A0A2A4K238_HELVI
METNKCGACDETMSEGAHCTVCNQTLHFHCAGITEAGHRKLGDRKLTWRCSKCKLSSITQASNSPRSPRPESESAILSEIRALSAKLAPLEGLKDEILAMKSEFADLKSSLSKEFNDTVKEFSVKINDMEHRILQMEKMQDQVIQLQSRLDKLDEESENKDQWSRMNNVEIKGLPLAKNENLFDILSKIGTKINYNILKTQINFITRVPSQQKDHEKPIIVSFCNRYIKEDFVAAARLESKTSPLSTAQIGMPGNHKIYVNDHLTLKNKILLSKTKKVAAEANFQYVWVKHAKIHARKSDTSPVLFIKSEKDLAKIV